MPLSPLDGSTLSVEELFALFQPETLPALPPGSPTRAALAPAPELGVATVVCVIDRGASAAVSSGVEELGLGDAEMELEDSLYSLHSSPRCGPTSASLDGLDAFSLGVPLDAKGGELELADKLACQLEHALGVPLDPALDPALRAAGRPELGEEMGAGTGGLLAGYAQLSDSQFGSRVLPPPVLPPNASAKHGEGAKPSSASRAARRGPAAPKQPVAPPTAAPAADGLTSLGPPVNPPSAPPGVAGRNGAERKEWSAEEDSIIRSSVVTFGCRWRKIASLMPGRSDDAVRNRWNRLKELAAQAGEAADGAEADGSGEGFTTPSSDAAVPFPPIADGAMPAAARADGGKPSDGAAPKPRRVANPKGARPERVSWSKQEDATIIQSVAVVGHKWSKIAEQLPGRTDHAIRNRFHRLQGLLSDTSREPPQLVFAPATQIAEPMHVELGGTGA